MKTRLTILAVLLLLFCLAVYHVRYVPLRTGCLRVSFSLRGYQTNEEGQVTPMFTISNGGPHVVYAGAGTESKIGPHRFWYNIPRRDTLNPGDQVSVSLEPRPSPESRLMAYCEKVYSQDWPGRRQALLDVYVLKRGVVERIYYDQAPSDAAKNHGAMNGSQPFRAGTNPTSSAAGSRR
jgi:hypothetical protein